MPIDAYALCPGGKDKKVKFCCGDLVGELEKIGRMLDGEQRQGCLEHVDRLMKKHTGRACLSTLKANLERQLGRTADAEKTLQELLAGQPSNPVALAEAASLAIREQGGVAGMASLQQALEAADGKFSSNLREAMITMFAALLEEGKPLAARHYLILYLQAIRGEDQSAVQTLLRLDAAPMPLLFKQNLSLSYAPAGAPFQAEFDENRDRGARGAYAFAAERFAQFAERFPDVPEVIRNLAVCRTILAENAAAAEAWRRYSRLTIPQDDAVEAEALAQALDTDAVMDRCDMLLLTLPIQNMDDAIARMSSDRRFGPLPVSGFSAAEGEPPPRCGYAVLDRPMPATAAGLSWETAPRSLGQVWLFGKQTDREARLELIVWRDERLQSCRTTLSEVSGDAVGTSTEETVLSSIGRLTVRLSERLLLPRDATPEQRSAIELESMRKLRLEETGRIPLTLLGGRTPEQAAGDPECRVQLLAFVLVMEATANLPATVFDFDELRRRWGLPVAEPIVVAREEIAKLPIMRLARLDCARLDDEALLRAYSRSVSVQAVDALHRLALEVVARPSLDQQIDKAEAYGLLAEIEKDDRLALEYIEKGREAAVRQGQSSAAWDLEEAQLRARRGESEKCSQLVEHLFAEHLNEPGVRQALQEMFYQFGLIDEKGTPVVPAGAGQSLEPSVAGVGTPAEPGQLWTPESERTQKSSLWLPGMQ